MTARPKLQYVRSEGLMTLYRSIPCQRCGCSDGTVCGGHSNWAQHGKGKGIKASDDKVASLCHQCHMDIDQGATLSSKQRYAAWFDAHRKTLLLLSRLGTWPANIQLPGYLLNEDYENTGDTNNEQGAHGALQAVSSLRSSAFVSRGDAGGCLPKSRPKSGDLRKKTR